MLQHWYILYILSMFSGGKYKKIHPVMLRHLQPPKLSSDKTDLLVKFLKSPERYKTLLYWNISIKTSGLFVTPKPPHSKPKEKRWDRNELFLPCHIITSASQCCSWTWTESESKLQSLDRIQILPSSHVTALTLPSLVSSSYKRWWQAWNVYSLFIMKLSSLCYMYIDTFCNQKGDKFEQSLSPLKAIGGFGGNYWNIWE